MTQHASLTAERWSRFDLAQQILQIAVEMQRALKFLTVERLTELKACYERALRLLDLTVEVQHRRNLRRELLRWRDVIADLYIREQIDRSTHESALRVLLQLHPESAKQVPLLGF